MKNIGSMFDDYMCAYHDGCPAKVNCRRHTKDVLSYQLWLNGEPEKGSGCPYYLPKEQ